MKLPPGFRVGPPGLRGPIGPTGPTGPPGPPTPTTITAAAVGGNLPVRTYSDALMHYNVQGGVINSGTTNLFALVNLKLDIAVGSLSVSNTAANFIASLRTSPTNYVQSLADVVQQVVLFGGAQIVTVQALFHMTFPVATSGTVEWGIQCTNRSAGSYQIQTTSYQRIYRFNTG